MSAQAVGSFAMSLFSGWLGREAQKTQNIVLDAEAAASNVVRKAKNVENAAVSSLANWMVAENNTRRLKAAGQQRAAAVQTLMRQREVAGAGELEGKLSAAEQAGAYAANAAMAGAAGASVDVVDMASRLKQQREQLYRTRFNAYQDYDTQQRVAGIIPQAIEGLDLTVNNAGVDFGQTFSRAQKPQGNFLLDAVQWAVANPSATQQLSQSASNFFNNTQQNPNYALTSPGAASSGTGFRSTGGTGFRMQ
jgi:hypothetical protein